MFWKGYVAYVVDLSSLFQETVLFVRVWFSTAVVPQFNFTTTTDDSISDGMVITFSKNFTVVSSGFSLGASNDNITSRVAKLYA